MVFEDRDRHEIEHHAKFAQEWWDPSGRFTSLRAMNKIRVPFIRDGLISAKMTKPELVNTHKVLDGINILEVGCGGGLLTEDLGRIYANVTAIDLCSELISVAKDHLNKHGSEVLRNKITYLVESIEEHAKNNFEKYDALVLSEIIEHITDKQQFLKSCIDAVKPGGAIFITTPNRTVRLWLSGIIFAEYIANFVPKGTHHWNKLITPSELQRMLDTMNCSTISVNGYDYEFWKKTWIWTSGPEYWYALQAIKN